MVGKKCLEWLPGPGFEQPGERWCHLLRWEKLREHRPCPIILFLLKRKAAVLECSVSCKEKTKLWSVTRVLHPYQQTRCRHFPADLRPSEGLLGSGRSLSLRPRPSSLPLAASAQYVFDCNSLMCYTFELSHLSWLKWVSLLNTTFWRLFYNLDSEWMVLEVFTRLSCCYLL